MIDYSFNKIVIKYSAISTGNDLNIFKMLDTGMHLTGFYSEEKRMFNTFFMRLNLVGELKIDT